MFAATLTIDTVLNSCSYTPSAPAASIPDNYIEFTLNGAGYRNVKITQNVVPLNSQNIANPTVGIGGAVLDSGSNFFTFLQQKYLSLQCAAIVTASNKDTLGIRHYPS
jgi:hypothetical protein